MNLYNDNAGVGAVVDKVFASDVDKGLSTEKKFLPSKYFYDKQGDELFQQIMALDEYYPFRCELDIFTNKKDQLLKAFAGKGSVPEKFQLVEFGAGDGYKTKILLNDFIAKGANFEYDPIDISGNILNILKSDLNKNIPDLKVNPITGDYFEALQYLNNKTEKLNKIILFLGGNIGNFTHQEAINFLHSVGRYMSTKDRLLIGFDLKKNPDLILNAYNDKQGVTKAFNLNLLERINRELGGNFNTNNFEHYPVYDPYTGEARSYLISLCQQKVNIDALNKTFYFDRWEPLFMEKSQKFSLNDIINLASEAGFDVEGNFFDDKHYYTNSLWQIKE